MKVKGIVELYNLLKKDEKYFLVTSGARDINLGNLHLKLNYEKYIQLLYVSDVTVILSKLNEGWNRVAHESVLCGTPVIGNGVGGLGELLKITEQTIFDGKIKFYDQYQNAMNSDISKAQNILKKYNYNYFKKEWQKLI